MKYGCIGEKLSHSFSKEIHEAIGGYEYSLAELKKDELSDFFKRREFSAINVTIPYKESVFPLLDAIAPTALEIGAVNTVVNENGRLIGYNTDIYGMEELIRNADLSPKGKKVLILGSGGTAKTARYVFKKMGASEIITASRNPDKYAVSYTEVYKSHTDSEIIVNTTPVGMFPNSSGEPIDIGAFKKAYAVIDAIYNPEKTLLLQRAKEQKIKAVGGLYMLVSQAIYASELFGKTKYSSELCNEIYEKILQKKKSIVLIGMPSSGKSTVGKILSDKLSRPFFDTDSLIEKDSGSCIKSIFDSRGEDFFRELEEKKIAEVSALHGAVISVGGGAVLKQSNVRALRANSVLVYIKKPLSALFPTETRPLSATPEALSKLYYERLPIYESTADCVIEANGCDENTADLIIKKLSLQ